MITCTTDCADGDVRLTSVEMTSPGTVEGTLEVCYNNIWGLISESGWTSKDAKVACEELGYIGEGVQQNLRVTKCYKALFALYPQKHSGLVSTGSFAIV